MIKKEFFLVLLFIMIFSNIFGQNRENVWMLGGGVLPDDTNKILECGVSFRAGIADTFSLHRNLGFTDTETGICDSTGSLLFYFNGILLNNWQNNKMLNSDSINPGILNGSTWYDQEGTLIFEGALTIPRPNHANQYYLFYENVSDFDNGYLCHNLRYSLVDMNLDSGLGEVVAGKKKISIVHDTLDQGGLAACKHANGRDWWVVLRKYPTNLFYTVLVTPDTISVRKQLVGSSFDIPDYERWATFSPDGSKYAFLISNFNDEDSIEVMDFDRCTGQFINPQIWRVPNTYGDACIFSPNSRFLYVIQQENLYQYDVSASTISNSLIKIDTFDGVGSWFAFPALGPDGKIYIGAWNAAKELNIINNPDSLGKACNFTQHSFPLPFYNFCTPYYPNYNLGALEGSQCDSLTATGRLGGFKFRMSIFPNPVTRWLNVEYESTENLHCSIYDITGKLISSFTLFQYFKNRMFDMSKLSDGIYILNVKSVSGKSLSKKIVKEGMGIFYK